MKLRDHREDLLKRLTDREYAAGYLDRVLAEGNRIEFLIALKDVVDAWGGVGKLASKAKLTRPSLYKALSKKGNPTVGTLQKILKPLGLRVSIALAEAREV